MNKTNTVLLSRNLKIKAIAFTFTVLCCLLYDMMLFNYRFVVGIMTGRYNYTHRPLVALINMPHIFNLNKWFSLQYNSQL